MAKKEYLKMIKNSVILYARTYIIKSYMRRKVGRLGFEPGMTEPKPVVLPLHHRPMRLQRYEINLKYQNFAAKYYLTISK